MYNWRKERNYRRVKDSAGNVIARIITVDGMDVEVSEEIYSAYAKMDCKERYVAKRDADKLSSLDELQDRHVPVELLFGVFDPGFEDALLEKDEDERVLTRIASVLPTLSEKERALFQALFIDDISMREYARQQNLHHSTVEERRNRLRDKLNRMNTDK